MVDNSTLLAATQELRAISVHGPVDLTSKQELFARAYAQGCSVAEAYRFAYDVGDDTAPATIRNNGYKVLNHPRVATRVRELLEAAGARTVQSTGYLIRELEEMVAADLNELMQLVVGACRHCYGDGHKYQWRNEDEYTDACVKALDARESPPSDAGGYG